MLRDMKGISLALSAAVWATVLATSAAVAQTADKFYEGKTIRIVVALGTGGDYDNYARIAGRYLGKYIPGNPTIVVQNMPGAGGLLAANHLANVAPKDGTVIGALHANTTLAQVTSAPNVEYDVRKFNWIGRTSSGGLNVHHTFASSGVKSFNDLLTREVVVGGGGPTSDSIVVPTAVNQMMGSEAENPGRLLRHCGDHSRAGTRRDRYGDAELGVPPQEQCRLAARQEDQSDRPVCNATASRTARRARPSWSCPRRMSSVRSGRSS